ncbi:MAG: methionine gamma-lyase family protein, partial [Clostridia bacterium]|nr:methionine gamma-lyase family protein [Clostridia bacterium]
SIDKKIIEAEKQLETEFKLAEEIALFNQNKVLKAFIENRISSNHFYGSTGYGYNDIGREKLCQVYAKSFGAEEAIVSQAISCGSHAITTVLFGLLRPGDTMLAITGKPYDTLDETIFGLKDKDNGSLKDFGVNYAAVDLKNDEFDTEKILAEATKNPKIIYIQRSCGYLYRKALEIKKLEEIIKKIRAINKQSIIVVDNCYCEFVEEKEPTEIGADIAVGSLIKNPGGGLASNGGYIVGKKKYIDLIAGRFTSPSLKMEVGSFEGGYRLIYQGLFMAPHTVLQAKKGSLLIGKVMQTLGYKTIDNSNSLADIVRSIIFEDKDDLINFCKSIQKMSPVDSFVTPIPSEMAGYDCEVVMSAGCFVEGSTMELSCDSPLRKPYILYIQGGLTYEHIKLALNDYLTNR